MPEEGIETQELKEKLDEAAEHGHHAHGEPKASWILQLSLSTAIIAVVAAIASLLSGSYANDALVKKNESILAQTKASDQWAFFQAKGIKGTIYRTQADVLAATGGEGSKEQAKKLSEDAKREKEEQEKIKQDAEAFEKKTEEADKESEHALHVHHEFAKSVTISQVAIALAAIAALTKWRPMWFISMIAGAASIVFFLRGLGLFGH